MRHPSAVLTVLLLIASPLAAADDDDVALRKFHPWGRFHVGSWNRVRIVTETVDEQGQVVSTSVSDTKATLIERGVESFSLKLEMSVEVAGKKIPSEPKIIKLGYAGENLGEQLTYRDVDGASVSIDGRRIDCGVQEVEIVRVGQRLVSLVRYADKIAPFVLQRKTTHTDPARPSQPVETTDFEVVELDRVLEVCGQLLSTARTRQIQRGARGSTETLSVVCPGVPGEMVSQSSEKADEQGRLIHRSSLELVSYYSAPPAAAAAVEDLPERRVPRRYHKRARHERR